jgi:hypothetical protein
MLDFSYGEGELVEIHGEMSTDLILVATSVQPWHPPAVEKSPAPPSDLYYGRAVLSAVLGDILGVIVLATKPSSSARDFLWAIIAISVSAALAALFARTNRKGNAVLGGVFALLVPLCIYLPLRLMHLVR